MQKLACDFILLKKIKDYWTITFVQSVRGTLCETVEYGFNMLFSLIMLECTVQYKENEYVANYVA